MFSFFKKKPPAADASSPVAADATTSAEGSSGPGSRIDRDRLRGAPPDDETTPARTAAAPAPAVPGSEDDDAREREDEPAAGRSWFDRLRGEPPQPATKTQAPAETTTTRPAQDEEAAAAAAQPASRLERWFERLRGTGGEAQPEIGAEGGAMPPAGPLPPAEAVTAAGWSPESEREAEVEAEAAADEAPDDRIGWLERLRGELRRTGSSIAQVFTGTRIDDELYEELETALLMADAGVEATEYLLTDLRNRVKETRAGDPAAVKALLVDAIADLLATLEKSLEIGRETPTVMMVVGVNGAGKTTTIGKLTRHLAAARQKVLLAAADTFRAAAREQLAVWADRNRVEIVSQQGADPGAVTYDAVVAGRARGCDVVIADTAGRLTTQTHLMEELKKIRRVIAKAQPGAPHEVLLVVDGNTGQNALSQVQAFDAALGLTGLVVTKLDGTAKGGVLAAIALWVRDRTWEGKPGIPVYFIGVGEKLEDLQTFSAREFAQALLG